MLNFFIDLLAQCGAERPEEDHSSNARGEEKGKPFFPHSHPFLVSLHDYLISRHGRSRSHSEAKQICNDVSRYLYFASPEALKENLLLDSVKLNSYLQSLEQTVQPSTQNAKLNRIRQGIHFLSLGLNTANLPKVQRVERLIKNWSAVLAKSKDEVASEGCQAWHSHRSRQPAGCGDMAGRISFAHKLPEAGCNCKYDYRPVQEGHGEEDHTCGDPCPRQQVLP